MKKSLIPLFFLAVMVSQAFAQWTTCTGQYAGYCRWNSGCSEIASNSSQNLTCQGQYDNCKDNSPSKTVYSTEADCKSGFVQQTPRGCCEWNPGTCWTVYEPQEVTDCGSKLISTSACASDDGSCGEGGGGGGGGGGGTGEMCLWNGAGDCWPVADAADRASCIKDAWLFQGGSQGKGTLCSGGSFIDGKNNSPPTSVLSSRGCCKWDTQAVKCFDIYSDQEVTDCSGGSNKYWTSVCPDSDGGCPTSNPTFDGTGGGGGGGGDNDQCSGSNWTKPGCPGYIEPIITLSTPFAGNALIAMQNAVNLQVKGMATLRVYDMKGKALSSQMIEQGNHVVSLQLPRGLYIIKATSGSWKQTVKVTVK
jgi:hypothetical protein